MPTRAAAERFLKPGDHAYVAPPFDQRGGSPYLIVRIVDLPPTPPGGIPKAKVAYYLRRRDVTNRSLADHRVIFATFMDGTIPLSHIRQKVQVMHRDYLEDPEAFKRQPDSFVFHQIYDRFMHKPFDLIPTSQVMNAPDNILEYLRENYEFVCTELGSSPGLCDAMRGCVTCHGFAAKDDSVTCTVCSKTWHLRCLEPPLLKKPALGWRWSCIKCTMEQDDDDDSDAEGAITPSSDRTASRAARRKSKPMTLLKNGKVDKGKATAVLPQLDVAKWKGLNGWPYRYFGEHVHHESVLDPHDPIWPRASTRVGTRFQCLEIPGEEPDTSIRRGPVPKKKRGRKKEGEVIPEPQRGLDEECEIFWQPQASSSDAKLEDIMAPVKLKRIANRQGNVDLIVQALKMLHKSSGSEPSQQRMGEFLGQPPSCASLAPWSETDMQTFDDDLEDHEDELGRYTRTRKLKSYPQIVHHYYREKGYQKRFMHLEDPAQDKFAAAGPQGIEAEKGDTAIIEDEEGHTSVVEDAPSGSGRKSRHECAMCGIDTAEVWYLCPEGVGMQEVTRKDRVMCPSCSIQWRHYGTGIPALIEGELDTRTAKDGKTKGRGQTARTSPSPPGQRANVDKVYGRLKQQADGTLVTIPVKSCVLCKRPEPKATNFECRACGLTVHSGCYGISASASIDDWLCDACDAAASLGNTEDVAITERSCYLCTKDLRSPGTALDAYKVTETYGYVHLICSLWHHEMTFEDVDTLQEIENMDLLIRQKFGPEKPTCSICRVEDQGACVKCALCDIYFHVGCAWNAGCRFSFEIRPVKEQWMSKLPRATFKDETGDMHALISCKSHPWTYSRLLYDLGQKDRNTDLTALMTFARYMKPLDTLKRYPLLNSIRCMSMGLNTAQPLLPEVTHLGDVMPTSMDDIYAIKEPYVKPVKQKRKKGSAKQAAASRISDAPTDTSTLFKPSQHKASGPVASGNAVALVQKKRKRRASGSSHGGSLATTSEDEVMPTATTTRARGAARTTRGVTLQDLLLDDQAHNAMQTAKGGTSQSTNGLKGMASESRNGHLPNMDSSYASPSKPSASASDVKVEETITSPLAAAPAATYPPPWQVLALSSLRHVYNASTSQLTCGDAKGSLPNMRRTSSSSSSAKMDDNAGRSPKREAMAAALPIWDSKQTTPTHHLKLESGSVSLNGDLSSASRVHSEAPVP